MAGARPSTRYPFARIAAALALAAAAGAPAVAQPSDLAVKAAFLTKFPSYLSWPAGAQPGPGTSFSICVVGGDPFGRLIDDAARGQQVGGRPFQVRRHGNAAAATGCQIAFVQGKGAASTSALLQGLAGRRMLTVTDGRAGGPQGMIHFTVQQGRVRFHIDQAAARRSGIDIDSRLLDIALSVKRGR